MSRAREWASMRAVRVVALVVVVAACVIVVVRFRRVTARPSPSAPASSSACAPKPSRDHLQHALDLGLRYLAHAQTSEGDFVYEYDWVARRVVVDDNLVRQAGATWAVSLGYANAPTIEGRASVERALDHFDRMSQTTPSGARYFQTREVSEGLGAVALVALAELELLQTMKSDDPAFGVHRARLQNHLKFLVEARRADDLFAGDFLTSDGMHIGDASPFSDGEAMLALARGARFLHDDDMYAPLAAIAEATWKAHAQDAIEHAAEGDEAKSFFQWSAMAYFELYETGRDAFRPFGRRVLEFADWMIDVHRIEERTHNTAYAIEGFIPALRIARELGDSTRARRYECVVGRMLNELGTWQVGAPDADAFIRAHPAPEEKVIGGVQSAADDPVLRIDVTQHQVHALLMTIESM